jgi:peptide/nickel transport system substrate-binding protein
MGSSAFAAGEEIVIETSPFSPANPTQWIDYSVANTQAAWLLNSVTCLKLLDYDEETGALVPEAAEAMPTVSPDGKTYTFTVRPGQWLQGSPSEPVTAESFKRAIERATSPFMAANLGSTPLPARPFVAGIEGSNDFYNGVGPFSGIQASGNVLTIQLSNPDPTFAKRISMPYFCGTRSDAPAGFVSGTPPHSGGPYFVAGTYAGGSGPTLEHTILLIPNGSYTGSRLQNLGTIRFVQHGHVDPEDYVLAAPAAYTPPAGVQIPPPTITSSVQIMALNTSRAPFDSMQMRRAASDAVNRIALSAVLGWQPTDQFVSPLLEGFEDVDAWPLAGNPAGAIANLAGATPAVTFCHDNSRAAVAALAETQLEAVGFQVTLVNPTQAPIFQSYFPYIGNPNNCDIAVGSFGPSYPDPSSILTSLFYGPTNPSFYNDPAFNARFGAASTMTPESARLHEYAGIDASAADMVLAIAMGYNVRRDAFADRIGCRIANNVLVGYAVNRLCIEVAETADPGGTISTGGDATPASPLQTSVTVPSGGDVTITQAQSDASELPARPEVRDRRDGAGQRPAEHRRGRRLPERHAGLGLPGSRRDVRRSRSVRRESNARSGWRRRDRRAYVTGEHLELRWLWHRQRAVPARRRAAHAEHGQGWTGGPGEVLAGRGLRARRTCRRLSEVRGWHVLGRANRRHRDDVERLRSELRVIRPVHVPLEDQQAVEWALPDLDPAVLRRPGAHGRLQVQVADSRA